MMTSSLRTRWVLGLVVGALIAGSPLQVLAAEAKKTRSTERSLEERLRQLEEEIRQLKAEKAAKPAPAAVQEQKVEQIEQKVNLIERQVDVQKEAQERLTSTLPTFSVGPSGFSMTSPKKDFQLRFRGYVQADNRTFIHDESGVNDQFLIRRARPIFEGTVFRYVDYRIMPDFGGSSPRLFDAFVDLKYFTWASLTVGKMKPPISLERLQSATALTFVERSYPTELAPNRSVGAMVHGHFWEDALYYQIGVYNSLLDQSNNDGDTDDNKELALRVFGHPFQFTGIEPLTGFGIGMAGSYGDPRRGQLGGYTSDGQATIFSYNSNVVAKGSAYRYYPQAYWYWGPFGAMAEYVYSSQDLFRTFEDKPSDGTRMSNKAWQVALSYVLTGENARYTGVNPRHALYEDSPAGIEPIRPFNPLAGDWGAFQVAARYEVLDLDKDAFPVFANPDSSVNEARGFTIGLNWFLNRMVKFQLNYEFQQFDGGKKGGKDRPDEQGILTRMQVAF